MDLVRQSLAIVFVLAVLWIALWFLRKKGWTAAKGARPAKGLLELRGRLALTPRHSIHLVRIGDRTVAIGIHPEGLTLLADTVNAESGGESKGSTS